MNAREDQSMYQPDPIFEVCQTHHIRVRLIPGSAGEQVYEPVALYKKNGSGGWDFVKNLSRVGFGTPIIYEATSLTLPFETEIEVRVTWVTPRQETGSCTTPPYGGP